jgi:hypothetical protein
MAAMKLMWSLKHSAVCMLPLLPALLHAAEIRGVVTRAGTPQTFFLNEREVHCTVGKTKLRQIRTDGMDPDEQVTCPQWFVGQSVAVRGNEDKSKGFFNAKVFYLDPPASLKVEGFAIVDRTLPPVPPATAMVRADGYVLRVTPKTKMVFADGTGRHPATNQWVHYAGTLLPDGTVNAQVLAFTPNKVSTLEGVMKRKSEYDSAAVKESDKQGGVNKFFLGRNAKKLPAYDDAVMQARVSSVGHRVVPEFQRNLPADDPTKIDFRFQLVDDLTLVDALALTSGIVLVSYQVVEAMPSDAELAALLAVGVAQIMQEQAVRALPGNLALSAAQVGALFVTGGLVGIAGIAVAQHVREQRREEQSTRVALMLMDDGGFDIREAPKVWWRLSTPEQKPLNEITMPGRSYYAYRVLSTAWHDKVWPAQPQVTP